MKNYRFVGKTSKEAFLIKGINVFNERWIHEGSCASYVFSKYISGGVEFVAGRDASGYWLFFVEV